MTRLATQDNPRFKVDAREVERDGPTYTLDTLIEMRAEGIERPVLILGVDAIRDMPNWHKPERMIELSSVVVAAKGTDGDTVAELASAAGFPTPPPLVDMPDIAISSTMIRERLRADRPVRYLVPLRVEQYIRKHALYGSRSG